MEKGNHIRFVLAPVLLCELCCWFRQCVCVALFQCLCGIRCVSQPSCEPHDKTANPPLPTSSLYLGVFQLWKLLSQEKDSCFSLKKKKRDNQLIWTIMLLITHESYDRWVVAEKIIINAPVLVYACQVLESTTYHFLAFGLPHRGFSSTARSPL